MIERERERWGTSRERRVGLVRDYAMNRMTADDCWERSILRSAPRVKKINNKINYSFLFFDETFS